MWDDPETALLPMIAALAQQYNRPFFEIVDHLKEVRLKHGQSAVQLEIDFAIGLRNAVSEKLNK